MKVFRIIITMIAYAIIALLETYWYSVLKCEAAGALGFFTFIAFVATFIYSLVRS